MSYESDLVSPFWMEPSKNNVSKEGYYPMTCNIEIFHLTTNLTMYKLYHNTFVSNLIIYRVT